MARDEKHGGRERPDRPSVDRPVGPVGDPEERGPSQAELDGHRPTAAWIAEHLEDE